MDYYSTGCGVCRSPIGTGKGDLHILFYFNFFQMFLNCVCTGICTCIQMPRCSDDNVRYHTARVTSSCETLDDGAEKAPSMLHEKSGTQFQLNTAVCMSFAQLPETLPCSCWSRGSLQDTSVPTPFPKLPRRKVTMK